MSNRPGHRTRAATAGLLVALTVAPSAWACGLDGANEAMLAVQRAYMGWRYPATRAIPAAVKTAVQSGAVVSSPKAIGPLALHQTTIHIKAFGKRIEDANPEGKVRYTLLYLEPMLWTAVEARDGTLRYELHAAGPTADAPIVLTEEAVVQSLLKGKLSFDRAETDKLLRIEGDPTRSDALRNVLQRAFPAPQRAASELARQ